MKKSEDTFRTLKIAAWLSWQIESNWTDPFLFAVYSIVKPVSGAFIIVIMYSIITNGDFSSPTFAYLFLGNALYQYVPALLSGVSWSVIDDREHYRTLKYFFIAPIRMPLFLFGRSLAKFLAASISVLITIIFGMIFFHLPINPGQINWVLFFFAMILGIIHMLFFGLLLAGVSLITVRHSYYIGEVVAAGLLVFTGALFPLDMLPKFLRVIGLSLPITYWLELIRRILIGGTQQGFSIMASFSINDLLGILIVTDILFFGVGYLIFIKCSSIAHQKGLIDQTSEY
jgi:ABC-2 type transport system permease protein